MKNKPLKNPTSKAPRVGLALLLSLIPFTTGCRIVAGGLTLVGLGAFMVGAGAYQAIALTGRAAVAAGVVTVAAVSGTGEAVVRGGQNAVEAGSDAARAVGSSVFIGGDFKASAPYDVQTCWNASYRTLYDMNFQNVDSEYDALSGWVTAETIDGKAVKIDLKQAKTGETEVVIRVGVRGDREASEVIWQRMADALELGRSY